MARWKLDPAHSGVSFTVRHMMVSKVRGTISGIDGWLEFDETNPANSTIEASVDVSTINTQQTDRDAHLRSADFFDVENYPTLTFKSTKVEVSSDNTGKVQGDLTVRGVTRPVTFDVEYFGTIKSPFGDTRAGFTGNVTINREDFGLTWNQALETGGVLVGKEVSIHVELETILETAEASV